MGLFVSKMEGVRGFSFLCFISFYDIFCYGCMMFAFVVLDLVFQY